MKKQLATFSTLPTKISPRRRGDTEEIQARATAGEFVQPLRITLILSQLVHSVWDTALAMLREVFDESAYDRFLVRTGMNRSADSYREFVREGEASMSRKPRCC